VEVL
jgi:hypothetical protein